MSRTQPQVDGASAPRTLGRMDLDLTQRLFDHLVDCPFFVKDADLRYVAANRAMLDFCKIARREDLLGRTAAAVFPDPIRRRYEALDRGVLSSGRGVNDLLDLSFDGARRPVWLLFARFAVLDAHDRPVGVAAASRRLPVPDSRHPTYVRLAGVVEHLQRRFREPLDLPGLARAAGVSRSQIERDFHALFNLTLRQYRTRLRIEHALMLLEGPAAVAEIAQECGYADHSAFTRRFRAAVGVSPANHRRGLKEPPSPRPRPGPTAPSGS